jgi:hypothetical protein
MEGSMKKIVKCLALFAIVGVAIAVSGAQDASKIATLTVKSLQSSYHLGEPPEIELTMKNVSQNAICFGISPQGTYDLALYDMEDGSAADLLEPLRRKAKESPFNMSFSECSDVDPGKSDVQTFKLPAEFLKQAGRFKLVVSRREVENRVWIVGNPVILEIVAK